MEKKTIYIADDSMPIRNLLKDFLAKDGFSVEAFSDGDSLLQAFLKHPSHMVITDIMMPKMNGYHLCSTLRSISNIPIIILSAKNSEPDKITGLSLGSDDYLTKPFSPMELVARVRSIFRRIEMDQSPSKDTRILVGDLTICPDSRIAQRKDHRIALTGMEFSLLYYLCSNPNKAISRNELLEKIWGFETEVETRATDDMIKRIRKKLDCAGSSLKIQTVWGYGFKIET
jgi:two-component system, OmpR family, response regulator